VSIVGMLKKISHIIISLLLLVSTTGIAISQHFCHDELVSTSVYNDTGSCCGENSCCHDESEFYKLNDEFHASDPVQIPPTDKLLRVYTIQVEYENTLYDVALSRPIEDRKPPAPPDNQTILSLYQVYLL